MTYIFTRSYTIVEIALVAISLLALVSGCATIRGIATPDDVGAYGTTLIDLRNQVLDAERARTQATREAAINTILDTVERLRAEFPGLNLPRD